VKTDITNIWTSSSYFASKRKIANIPIESKSIEETVDSNYDDNIPNYIDYSHNESNDKLDT
jgi:hypothetical protein